MYLPSSIPLKTMAHLLHAIENPKTLSLAPVESLAKKVDDLGLEKGLPLTVLEKSNQEHRAHTAELYAFLKAKGWVVNTEHKEDRLLVYFALRKLYQESFMRYGISDSSVLEIGAGELDERKESYLSQYWLKHPNWTYSDFFYTVEYCRLPAQRASLTLDLTEPLDVIPHTYKVIIGSNTLDCLPYYHFPQAFKNINKLLAEDGVFIHTADLLFNKLTFLLDCAEKEDCVVLPCDSQRVFRIHKADYDRILEENKEKLTEEERHFYKTWGNKSSYHQAIAIFEDKEKISKHFVSRIKTIFDSKVKTLYRHKRFPKKLKKAAVSAGFTVEMSAKQSAKYLYSKNLKVEGKYNGFHLMEGTLTLCEYIDLPTQSFLMAESIVFTAKRIK